MIQITQFLHIGLIISDLARAKQFYEGVLGLTPSNKRPALSFEGVWYNIGINQIHLMCVPDPYQDAIKPAHGGRDIHLALAVDDVEPVIQALERAGVAYTKSMSGRAAVFCRDPDGNAIEFSAIKLEELL